MRRRFHTILRENVKSLAILPGNTQMVALQPKGEKPPFFIVDSYPYFIDVVKLTGADQPVLSLIGHQETPLSEPYSIFNEANAHVKTILAHQPRGPYLLGGCSSSGIVAYEIAQQLRASGREVGLLVMFDTPNPFFMREYSHFWRSIASYRDDLSKLRWNEVPGWAARKLRGLIEGESGWFRRESSVANGASRAIAQFEPSSARIAAARKYRPALYPDRFLLIRRSHGLTGRYLESRFGWGEVVSGEFEICRVSAVEHLEIFKCERDRVLVAQTLRRNIDEVVRFESSPERLSPAIPTNVHWATRCN